MLTGIIGLHLTECKQTEKLYGQSALSLVDQSCMAVWLGDVMCTAEWLVAETWTAVDLVALCQWSCTVVWLVGNSCTAVWFVDFPVLLCDWSITLLVLYQLVLYCRVIGRLLLYCCMIGRLLPYLWVMLLLQQITQYIYTFFTFIQTSSKWKRTTTAVQRARLEKTGETLHLSLFLELPTVPHVQAVTLTGWCFNGDQVCRRPHSGDKQPKLHGRGGEVRLRHGQGVELHAQGRQHLAQTSRSQPSAQDPVSFPLSVVSKAPGFKGPLVSKGPSFQRAHTFEGPQLHQRVWCWLAVTSRLTICPLVTSQTVYESMKNMFTRTIAVFQIVCIWVLACTRLEHIRRN